MALAPPTTLHQLLKTAGKFRQYSRGEVIQSTDEQTDFNLILSGYVKRYLIVKDGSLGIEAIYGPGDVFSLTLIYKELLNQSIYEGPETYYFEALDNCETYSMHITPLKQYVSENPGLYKDLLAESGKRIKTFIEGLENIAMGVAYNRIVHLLLYYAQQFGEETTVGTQIKLPLTHYDLASILNVTRETVTANIIKLRDKQLIKTGRNIIVLDITGLKAEAYS